MVVLGMRAIVFVLTSLACQGYGSRIHSLSYGAHGNLLKVNLTPRNTGRLAQRQSDRKALSSEKRKTFATLISVGVSGLMSLRPVSPVAWQVVSSGPWDGITAKGQDAKHPRTRADVSSQWARTKVAGNNKDEDQRAASGVLDRRAVLASLAALSGPLLASSNLRSASAEGDDVEYTVSMATLIAGLAAAPPRNVIITGCNSGVGLAGAKLLAASGHRVVCACRTQAKADAAVKEITSYASSARSGGFVRGAECDLASLASVRSFAKSLDGSTIDTLVLNAGLSRGVDQKEPTRTAEGFEETIGVNHLGHFLLANLLTPQLAASQKSRIVVTASSVHDPGSGGGKIGPQATLGDLAGLAKGADFEMVDGGKFDADKAYKDSKLCNMMFMAEASRQLSAKGITVNAFSPGLIAEPQGFFRNQNQLFANAFNLISKVLGFAESNEFGGAALAYLAVDPAVEGVTGSWFDAKPPGKHQLLVHSPSEEARRLESQRKLWQLSSKLVGVDV